MNSTRISLLLICGIFAWTQTVTAQSGSRLPAAPSFAPSVQPPIPAQIQSAIPTPINGSSVGQVPLSNSGYITPATSNYYNSGSFGNSNVSSYGNGPSFQEAVVPGCCGQRSFTAPTLPHCYRGPNHGSNFCYGRSVGRPIFGRWQGF